MIEVLINDIVFDNIDFSQTLSRAKLIASKVNSELFKSWLKNELEEYTAMDDRLPIYRKLYSPLCLTIDYPYGDLLMSK